MQEGVTYTLQVDVGWRKDAGPGGVPRLRVNNVYYDGVGTPVYGRWATFTATYVGRAADVGLPITICLSSTTHQGNFDNVRLSDSTTPTGVAPSVTASNLQLDARPNPFGASTRLYYSCAGSSVDLGVYDVTGQRVRSLLRATPVQGGPHEASWDGRSDAGLAVEPGIYFVRLSAQGETRMIRVLRIH